MAVVAQILPGALLTTVIMWPSCYTAEGAVLKEIHELIGAFVEPSGNYSQRDASAEGTQDQDRAFGNGTTCQLLPGKTIHERFFNALSTMETLKRPWASYLGELFSGGPGCRPENVSIPGATLHERFLRVMRHTRWPHRLDNFLHGLSANEWLQDFQSSRMNILLLPFLLSFVMSRLRGRGAYKLEGSSTADSQDGVGGRFDLNVGITAGRNTQAQKFRAMAKCGRLTATSAFAETLHCLWIVCREWLTSIGDLLHQLLEQQHQENDAGLSLLQHCKRAICNMQMIVCCDNMASQASDGTSPPGDDDEECPFMDQSTNI